MIYCIKLFLEKNCFRERNNSIKIEMPILFTVFSLILIGYCTKMEKLLLALLLHELASVTPMLTSVNISPFSYNSIYIIRLDHSNIMDDILTSKFAVVISSKLASCL